MIEIEIQNETHQTQERVRFAAVPRIGEGIRLREPDGVWASYDVIDVWYQKAEFGEVWMPYLHICMTPDEPMGDAPIGHETAGYDAIGSGAARAEMAHRAPPVAPSAQSGAHPIEHAVFVDPNDEDEEHDLHGEGAFASLAGEAEPFKI